MNTSMTIIRTATGIVDCPLFTNMFPIISGFESPNAFINFFESKIRQSIKVPPARVRKRGQKV